MTSPIDIEGGGTSVVVDGEPGPETKSEVVKLEGRSPGQLMWMRFKRDRTGVISAYVVGFFFLIGLLAPLISKLYGKDPYTVYADERPELFDSAGVPIQPNGGISGEFWFGLEPGNGYDVFTKLIYGIRTSLMISVAVTVAVVVTGILLGVTAGYIGGKTDYFLGRVIDFLLAFPAQLFFIASMPVVVSLFVSPRDETPTYVRVIALILVQWFLGWMGLGRILRGTALALREREFIEAAKVSGAKPWRIIRKEILPNIVTPLLVQSTYLLPGFVTAEAGLSYLGVGIVEPTPDWGQMFSKASTELVMQNDITYMFFPGISMIIFVVAFNLLGDSVRDAFDPKTAR
ncbi:peptide/nickel transport system permease protein [Streptomyces sp. 1222.5]|uniref:ABC transporter permease n=1 Tax=unclassified Streptomyces TaxID=2593676 RepID=UPI000898DF79|nr:MULTISPECIES: ABC transporter permease [unclassified Streptomyces]PKW09828.1 peptide/nickel transport system permease protein [Streptomyces sp. 5112.2]SEC23579.1 peptide/nickel transport system permease protein [Streptomyces sp. 1222.5]SED69874.1 peptide/nickel transport system permease protein [Streptomyces sp. 2231.1]